MSADKTPEQKKAEAAAKRAATIAAKKAAEQSGAPSAPASVDPGPDPSKPGDKKQGKWKAKCNFHDGKEYRKGCLIDVIRPYWETEGLVEKV